MMDGNIRKTIPCDRPSIGAVIFKMLRAKRTDLWLRGMITESRLWRAFTPHFMTELSCDEMTALLPTTSINEFLQEYGILADDASCAQSGVTPLALSVLAGNAAVVSSLAIQNPSDVIARVKSDFRKLGIVIGVTPLHLAVTYCPGSHTKIITTLLEHGADPNAAFDKAKLPPLFCAAVSRSFAGVNALIACAADRLEIDKENGVVSDSPLGAAAYLGTLEIVEALLAANADPTHMTEFGSTLIMSACENPASTPEVLSALSRHGNIDINSRRQPQTVKWDVVFRLFETMVRRGILTSQFAMDLAHARGGTALHSAAHHGHTWLVKWLLENGARPSLYIRDVMGCTPLDASRAFGPFPDTEAVLTQTILEELHIVHRLSARNDRVPEPPQPAISDGEPVYYPMYLLPVGELLGLSVLPRHEDLLETARLVQWRPTMSSIFYVSLECSEGHPDPGGKRLDVLKKLLIRMADGKAHKVEADFGSQAFSGGGLKITPVDWKRIVRDAHIWIAYCSCPTVPENTEALRSYSGYIARATHYFALCPPVPYHESSRICDYGSLRRSGRFRVELSALLLASHVTPAIVIKGGDSPTPAITLQDAIPLSPGQGEFDCCKCGHVRTTDAGVSISIQCEKPVAGRMLMALLKRRIERHRESDETRLWKALSPRFVEGLLVETPAAASTVAAFLIEYRYPSDFGLGMANAFRSSTEGRRRGSALRLISDGFSEGSRLSKRGVSPLLLAVMGGNLEVTSALIQEAPANVTARLKSDFPALGLWAGAEPIHAAAAFTVTDHVPIITALLEAGADPNAAAGKVGITPLYETFTFILTLLRDVMGTSTTRLASRLCTQRHTHTILRALWRWLLLLVIGSIPKRKIILFLTQHSEEPRVMARPKLSMRCWQSAQIQRT